MHPRERGAVIAACGEACKNQRSFNRRPSLEIEYREKEFLNDRLLTKHFVHQKRTFQVHLESIQQHKQHLLVE